MSWLQEQALAAARRLVAADPRGQSPQQRELRDVAQAMIDAQERVDEQSPPTTRHLKVVRDST